MSTVVKTNQILVHAPVQVAFEYVSDLNLHPEWNNGLKIEEVAPDPIAVGKEYTSHGVVAVQKDRPNTVRVSQYEHPHKFGFTSEDPDFGEVLHVFTFNEQNGDVLITRKMTVEMNSVMVFLFNTFVYPLVGGPAMERSMATLKMKLEEKAKNSSQ